VPDSPPAILETLRGRIIRGLHAGTLEPGDRLPSARELVAEFEVDHRLILAAYKQLAAEGLVDVRERGGVYVALATPRNAHAPQIPLNWVIDTFADAYAREVPALSLVTLLQRSIETLRLRAVVISTTADQVSGLARELRNDFGLEAEGVVGASLRDVSVYPSIVRHADVIVVTEAHAELGKQLSEALGKPCISITVRPDLVIGEWAMLLRQPAWAIVATPEFGDMLLRFFAGVKGIENLTILVHGRDDLSTIPEGAPVYVTHRVRAELDGEEIRGRLLPAARTISLESARALFDFIVRANLRAREALSR
jgi:DNA-binding transcriptional regulator YhcF (GntR family)